MRPGKSYQSYEDYRISVLDQAKQLVPSELQEPQQERWQCCCRVPIIDLIDEATRIELAWFRMGLPEGRLT